jgi:hypothetical protein
MNYGSDVGGIRQVRGGSAIYILVAAAVVEGVTVVVVLCCSDGKMA